ncbi:pilus assembly PilX family protein [Thalassolituus sp. LLYu03]|uniref:pilus assembly PilX family protein n=1 Tax=Thalassolituus sp. LLYu03 TaxID=3421656 RepID=UPI003D2A3A1E
MMKRRTQAKQNGSALIVGLVILTAITMGAMVAMQRSGVQIRMVSNLQHEQELSNAAMSTLNYLYDKMESNGTLQNAILTKAETLYRESLTPDPATGESSSPSFDPFSTYPNSLTVPEFEAKSIARNGITAEIQSLPSPSGNNFYLKGKGGCGSGCSVIHTAITVQVNSKNNVMTSSQEIGARRLTPGGTNQ